MKSKLNVLIPASVLFCLSLTAVAAADPRVGNGGGTWVCEERVPRHTHRWLEFVDFFEAEQEFGLKLADTGEANEWELYDEKLRYIAKISPALWQLIVAHPMNISKVLRFIPENVGLTVIEDAAIRVRPLPQSCENGYLYYGQLANFTLDGRLLIASRFWNDAEFSSRERAGLLVHEAVYKALREGPGDKVSTRARQIVGLLFSQLSPMEIGKRIQNQLNQQAPQLVLP